MPSVTAMKWTDTFAAVDRKGDDLSRSPGHKTSKADVIRWGGVWLGKKIEVISTVRLVYGNLAHFVNNSGARIGCHDWNLPGGHYVDLQVRCGQPLTDDDLLALGRLAASEDTRMIRVRRYKERLAEGLAVPKEKVNETMPQL
jgi:hypothetical protein